MRFNIANHSFLNCAVFILFCSTYLFFFHLFTLSILQAHKYVCGYVMYLYIRFDFLIHRARFLFAYCFQLFLCSLYIFCIFALDASSYVLIPAIMIYGLFLVVVFEFMILLKQKKIRTLKLPSNSI